MKNTQYRCPCGCLWITTINLLIFALLFFVLISAALLYETPDTMVAYGASLILAAIICRWIYQKRREAKERRCVTNECACYCHYVAECSCRCHYICNVFKEINELESVYEQSSQSDEAEPEIAPGNHCKECRWNPDVPGFPCKCPCHDHQSQAKETKPVPASKNRLVCACFFHRWCDHSVY